MFCQIENCKLNADFVQNKVEGLKQDLMAYS